MSSKKKNFLIIGEKKKYVIFFFSLILTILLLLTTIFLIQLFYHPNTEEIIERGTQISVRSVIYFHPEPVERMQYIISLFLLPFFSAFSYFFVNFFIKSIKNINSLYTFSFLFSLISMFLLIYYDIEQVDDYSLNSYLFKFPAIYSFIILAIALIVLKKKIFSKITIPVKLVKILFFTIVGVIFISVFSQRIFDIQDLIVKGLIDFERAHDLETVFYSVSQVYAGKALLSYNFLNLYGLYPHFLEIVFKLTGGISVFKFTFIMALLSGLSAIFVSLSLYFFIKNKGIAIIGISFYFVFYLMVGGFITPGFMNDPYFQYNPIRSFFPSFFIFLSLIYFRKKSRLLYYFIAIISSLSVLWNLDTGVIVFFTWLMALSYNELSSLNFKEATKKILIHFVKISIIFLIIILCYVMYIFLTRGFLPDLKLLFKYQSFYYLLGFNMLPMKFIHPWNIVFLTYIIGFLHSIISLFAKKNGLYRSTVIFTLSVLGLGVFSFFQGRSADTNLWGPMYCFVLLLIIFSDCLYDKYKKNGLSLYHSFIFFVLLVSFQLSYFPYWLENFENFTRGNYKNLNYVVDNLTRDPDKTREVISNISFIKEHTNEKEKIIIISTFPGAYYAESDTISAFDSPGLMELFLKKDIDNLITFIRDNKKFKIFVTKIYHVGEYEFLTPEVERLIIEKYRLVGKNDSSTISLYEPIK